MLVLAERGLLSAAASQSVCKQRLESLGDLAFVFTEACEAGSAGLSAASTYARTGAVDEAASAASSMVALLRAASITIRALSKREPTLTPPAGRRVNSRRFFSRRLLMFSQATLSCTLPFFCIISRSAQRMHLSRSLPACAGCSQVAASSASLFAHRPSSPPLHFISSTLIAVDPHRRRSSLRRRCISSPSLHNTPSAGPSVFAGVPLSRRTAQAALVVSGD